MTASFSLDVGLLLRGAVRTELARARFMLADKGCVIEVEEQKQWLGSLFLVRAKGPDSAVRTLVAWADRIVDEED